MRDIERAGCSCGGTVTIVELTDAEDAKYGCGRCKGCCDFALECDKCRTRFVLGLEAPEMEWND